MNEPIPQRWQPNGGAILWPAAAFLLAWACLGSGLGCQRQAPPPVAEIEDFELPQPAGDLLAMAKSKPKAGAKPEEEEADMEHPFPRRVSAPPLDGGIAWINTSGPLDLKDLRGKFVLLDFWTYCCINCIHVLPELKKLERAYPNELVVIGVHSAKFDTEQDSQNIADAVVRYEIEHPVVNDAEHEIWERYGVSSWPSLRLIDPQGNLVAAHSGEIEFAALDAFLQKVLPFYREKGLLDTTPLHFDLESAKTAPTQLRFPGKILADGPGRRLFIADSNHNRIVIASLDGQLIDVVGTGAAGAADGDFQTAQFDHPQGMALNGEMLYVADTENHLLRKVHLKDRQVTTIAGLGQQGRDPWPGLEMSDLGEADVPPRFVGPPLETGINSPWDLWIHGRDLYIAMAGPHQIWKMPLDETEIGPYAGNGREDIIDGPLLPKEPYQQGYAAFAQPSGLASDGKWLYVADSEGSSIRAVPFDPNQQVRTVIGTADLAGGRLFTFGDVDGPPAKARLQHPLGVVYQDKLLYVADTYNNKIKIVDPAKGTVKTFAGSGQPGATDAPATFDEPTGLSAAAGKLYVADTNNHLIRTVDLKTGKVSTLPIEGLAPPTPPKKDTPLQLANAAQVALQPVSVRAKDGKVRFSVQLELPLGYKINKLAPMRYQVQSSSETGPVDRQSLTKPAAVGDPAAKFEFALPITKASGGETLRISLPIYYCEEGAEGLCKVAGVVWTVPVTLDDAGAQAVVLRHEVQ